MRYSQFSMDDSRAIYPIFISDHLSIAGNRNALPDPPDETIRHILDWFSVRGKSANGGQLVNFASLDRLVVASTRLD